MQPKLEKIFPNLSSSIAVKIKIVPYMRQDIIISRISTGSLS
jgi:hypothetical protein